MIATLILEIKVFFFIMAIFAVVLDVLYIISVINLNKGKLISSKKDLVIFLSALAYILTMIICGF